MAGFGARYMRFAKINTEPEGGLPMYDGSPVTVGAVMQANRSVQYASGEAYGDDVLQERVELFVSASISVQTVDILDNIAAKIYGAEVKDSVVHYRSGDEPPIGGLGYIQVLMRKKKTYFRGIFHPKVQAVMGDHSAQSKTGSISFTHSNTTFTVYEANTGDWVMTKEFDNEAAAKAWIDAKLGYTQSTQTQSTQTAGASK